VSQLINRKGLFWLTGFFVLVRVFLEVSIHDWLALLHLGCDEAAPCGQELKESFRRRDPKIPFKSIYLLNDPKTSHFKRSHILKVPSFPGITWRNKPSTHGHLGDPDYSRFYPPKYHSSSGWTKPK
jgi:hypothetical protein